MSRSKHKLPSRIEAVRVAREFVGSTNALSECAQCGAQPIEWHNPSHVQGRQGFRISNMAGRGYSVDRIKAEMDASTPLCRKCHLLEDGRLARLPHAVPRERHAHTKLSQVQVDDIRRRLAAIPRPRPYGTIVGLAREYGVTAGWIRSIATAGGGATKGPRS